MITEDVYEARVTNIPFTQGMVDELNRARHETNRPAPALIGWRPPTPPVLRPPIQAARFISRAVWFMKLVACCRRIADNAQRSKQSIRKERAGEALTSRPYIT